VKDLKKVLSCVLGDKGYDSMRNRKYCLNNKIEVHIPFRKFAQSRQQESGIPSKRKILQKKFNKNKYNHRSIIESIIESINSSIKRTLGPYVCSHRPDNQQKQVTIKSITYNIKHINKKIKIWIFINC